MDVRSAWNRRPAWLAAVLRPRTKAGRIRLASVSVILAALAATLIVLGATGQHHAPQPPAAAAVPIPVSTAPVTVAPAPRTTPKATPTPARSSPLPTGVGDDPIQLTVPSIGVTSNLMLLGLNPDRSVEVPPLSDVGEAGWYKYSPTPGAIGPAVILGHIDSAVYGKGVFFDLGDVRQGDGVTVLRADHMVARFTVTRVIETPKTNFPTTEVYGNTPDAELRLITCGGQFDSATRNYLDNIIVFATLVSLRHT